MWVPGPVSCLRFARPLAVCMLLILGTTATVCAETAPSGSTSLPALSSEVVIHFPPSLFNRFPKDMATPVVSGPSKKLDPRFDVAMIGRRNVGKGMDFYSIDK